jgi:hypothetical protein
MEVEVYTEAVGWSKNRKTDHKRKDIESMKYGMKCCTNEIVTVPPRCSLSTIASGNPSINSPGLSIGVLDIGVLPGTRKAAVVEVDVTLIRQLI